MKRFYQLLLLSAASAITVLASAQTNPLHVYLPSDAKAVINISLPSLATKMSWQDIQKLSFFEELMKDAPLQAQEFLKDPASSGIDFRSDLFLVLTGDGKDKSKSRGQLYGSIADPAKFAATMQQFASEKGIKKAGNISVLVDNKNVIAWTPKVFVIPFPPKNQPYQDNPGGKKSDAAKEKMFIAQCQALLKPVTHPLSADERFRELAGENGDVRLWISRSEDAAARSVDADSRSVDAPGNSKKSNDLLKMMNLGMLQQGRQMAGVLRFEDGKAVMQMKNYLGKSLDSLYRLYPATKINNDVLKKFPGGQPVVLLSFTISPQMIGAIIKSVGIEKSLDSLAKKSSFNPVQLMGGLNGDITLAIIRAHEFEETDTVTAALGGIQVFLAASVKDRSKVQPFVDHLKKPKEEKKDQEEQEEEGATRSKNPFSGLKPTLLLDDKFFVVSISQAAAEKFLSSAGDNDISKLASPYLSNASLFVLDLKSILGFAMQMSKKKTDDNKAMEEVQKTFDKIVLYGGRYENGAMISTGELHFNNKQENGLKQFMSLLEMAAQMEMNKKKSKSIMEDVPASEDQ